MTYELPKLAEDFINHLKVNNKSDNTTKGYAQILHDVFAFLVDCKNYKGDISSVNAGFIRSLTIRDLNAFIARLSDKTNNHGCKLTANTKSRYVTCIKSFFKYLNKSAKVINKNITVDLEKPKIPKKISEYLNLDDIDKLLNSIDNTRDYAIIMIFLNTGIRLSELVNLKLNDITKDNYGVKITVRYGKGGKDRILYLPSKALEAVNNYINIRPDCSIENLFVINRKGIKELSCACVAKMVKKYIKKSGINIKAHPHTFRHTFTSIANANGADLATIQEALGHEDISTTAKYMHNFSGNTSKIAQLVDVGK